MMVDNSSIKPVAGLGNISQLTPAKRKEQRKKQDRKNKNMKNQSSNDDTEQEQTDEEKNTEENSDALGIDFCA